MNIRFGLNTVVDPSLSKSIESHWLETLGKTLDKQFPGHDTTLSFTKTPAPKGVQYDLDQFFKARIETPTDSPVEIGPRSLIGLRSFTHVLNLADALGQALSNLKNTPYNPDQVPEDFLNFNAKP